MAWHEVCSGLDGSRTAAAPVKGAMDSQLITAETIRELNPVLMKAARRFTARHEDAEDLLQETWCSALKASPGFGARSSLVAWLRSIMRNRNVDRVRRERFSELLDEEYHAAPGEMPLELLERARAAQQATRMLRRLTSIERVAVTLCDVEELERDEAAAQLNVSRGHLRVILHRAHNKLQRGQLERSNTRPTARCA
jgi:RNA polymerase sigma-70 factor (ECF subfamily)